MRGRGMMLRGRRVAAERMTELVQFFTVVDGSDPVTFEATKVETNVGAPVMARLRSDDRAAKRVEVAGQLPAVSSLVLSVPVGTIRVGAGVSVRVTASDADPGLVGVVVRTLFEPTLGQVTAWRYPVEAVSRG